MQNLLSERTAMPDKVIQLLASRSMFWKPAYIKGSAWMEHIPFAFWIMETHRPSVFVELGTHYGASYFGFCQAIAQLGLNTRSFAVDTWKGDEHAGFYDETVFSKVDQYNTANYSGFSRLVRSTFNDALGHFSDGSIDLLHVDGHHSFESVKNDFEIFLPKLSSRAVVLFHDTNVRERGFGVFQLMESLREQYPCFEFVHGHGLGVVLVGNEQTDLMQLLAASDRDDLACREVREIFGRLGRGCADAMYNASLREQEATLRKRTTDLQKKVDDASAEKQKSAAALTLATKERDQARNALQKEAEDTARTRGYLESHLKQIQEAYAEAKADASSLRVQLSASNLELGKLLGGEAAARREVEFVRAELDRAQAALKTLENETKNLRESVIANAGLSSEINLLQGKLDAAASLHKEQELKVHNLREAAAAYETTVRHAEELQKQLAAAELLMASEIDAKDKEVADLRTELQTQKDAVQIVANDSQLKIEALVAKLGVADEQLGAQQELKNRELKTAEEQNKMLEIAIESRFKEIATLTRTLFEAQAKINQLQEQQKAQDLELTAARSAYEALEQGVVNGQQEIETAKRALADGQITAAEAEKRISEIQDSASLASERIAELESQASLTSERLVAAENELVTVKADAIKASRRERRFRRNTTLMSLKAAMPDLDVTQPEGIDPRLLRSAIIAAGLFDEAWYLENNPDVRDSGMEAYTHFILHGIGEERPASAIFNIKEYFLNRPDIKSTGINPIEYYVLHDDLNTEF